MKWWPDVIAMELRKIFAYRTDFWVTFMGQVLITLFIARALWAAIFEASGQEVMEGFTLPMMTLYFLIIPFGSKMLQGENMGFISREIYDGTFNRYLIYPISFFQYKTVTYLTYSAFYGLQLILVYSAFNLLMGTFTLPMIMNLILGVVIYFMASFVYCMLSIFVELISLWADNTWSLSVMLRFIAYFLGGSFVPINFFPEWSVGFLSFTPFPYLISLPVKTIMGLTSSGDILQGIFILIFWAMFFILAAHLLWRRGEKRYTGVGI